MKKLREEKYGPSKRKNSPKFELDPNRERVNLADFYHEDTF